MTKMFYCCGECRFHVHGRCWHPSLIRCWEFVGRLMDEGSWACHLFHGKEGR